jgi:hypothetical protein
LQAAARGKDRLGVEGFVSGTRLGVAGRDGALGAEGAVRGLSGVEVGKEEEEEEEEGGSEEASTRMK